MRLNLNRIESAWNALPAVFRDTPSYECESLNGALNCNATLKIETLNPIGCFKGRGSHIAVENAKDAGFKSVVCASAGNLGQAVAYCSRALNLSSIVYASRAASPLKLNRIKELGAELRLVDGDIEVAREQASLASKMENSYLIEDSENISTCEGAATIGLELIAQGSPQPDVVLVSLGGGAMASGIGFVMKKQSPLTEVICVQPNGAPAMTLSWREKRIVNTDSINTIADGVAGRFPILEVLEDLLEVIDDAVLVQENSIRQGMRLIHEHAGLIVEPAAALGVAAIIEDLPRFAGRRVSLILCGSNVSDSDFGRWVGDEAST
ncbi:MAG: pyridoxal-phosphate dependent enzyme [Planctomycetota bacterium]